MRSKAPSSISGPTSVPGFERIADRHAAVDLLQARRPAASSTVSCTISRRSVVQRWPAVPTAAKMIARTASSRSARRRDDHRVVAAELQQRAAEALPRRAGRPRGPCAVEPVALTSGDARVVDQRLADLARRRSRLRADPSGAIAEALHARLATISCAGERGQRRLLRRLPHHRIAAHERERGVPRPHRDREIERGDDADRRRADARCSIMRWPGRSEAMVRP